MNLMITKLKKFRDRWFRFVGFLPHFAQERIIALTDEFRFSVVCAGRRLGKSKLACSLAEIVLLQPNKNVAILAPTYRDAKRLYKIIYEDMVTKGKYQVEGSGKSNSLSFPWGSELEIISTDNINSAKNTASLGTEFDYVILEEAARIDPQAWDQNIRPALSTRRGKAILISTPLGFSNWFYEKYMLGQDPQEPEWSSIQVPTHENTFSFSGPDDPELQEARRNMSKEAYDQNYLAKFTSMAGRVFSEFNRDTHVKKINYERGWNTYMALDFGYHNPYALVIQTGKSGNDDQIRIINEVAGQDLTDEQFMIKIKDMIKINNYNIDGWVGDSAGAGVQSGLGRGPIETFRRNGININYKTDKLSKSIPTGVDHVRKYIKNANGNINLFVADTCTHTIKSLEGYVYPEAKAGRAVGDLPLKDDINDHAADALRYFAVWKFPLRATYAVGYSAR